MNVLECNWKIPQTVDRSDIIWEVTLTGYVICFGNNNKIHPFVYKEWLKKMFAVICSAGIWRSAY